METAQAGPVARILAKSDRMGVFTHGTKLLRGYMKRMRAGGLRPKAKPTITREGPAWAVVDGGSAMGQVASITAMEIAMAKARSAGVGLVSVKNSCHFGAAGVYALMAAEQGMIGLAMSNDSPSMTAPGARSHMMGTNPFAVAIPGGEEKPVLLDIAMSTVAGSKVYAAVSQGKPIPNNWIVDQDGLPTTDAKCYPHSASMVPMSGHKGYGLAIMVEVLSGLLSGGAIRWEICSWIFDKHDQPTNHCHAFLAIDVGQIVPMEWFRPRITGMIRDLRNSPKAKGSDRIFLPGEMEWEKFDVANKEGLELPKDVMDNLVGLAQDVGLNLKDYFK